MTRELDALKAVDFDWTRHLQSVWDDNTIDTSELNGASADDLVDHALNCRQPGALSPLGRVVIGAAGSGKTHLVGELRRRIWEKGGWFVLLDLADVNDFWATVVLCYLQSLQRRFPSGMPQDHQILLKLCADTPAIGAVLRSKFHLISNGDGKEVTALGLARSSVGSHGS